MNFFSNVAKNKVVKPSVQRMHQRNAIEGTLSELTRGHGMRRSRYRGFGKVELQNLLIGTACNVKRWLRLLIREGKRTQTQAFGLKFNFQSLRECVLRGPAQPFWKNVSSWRALQAASVSA
jgi:Transposase DDE domain